MKVSFTDSQRMSSYSTTIYSENREFLPTINQEQTDEIRIKPHHSVTSSSIATYTCRLLKTVLDQVSRQSSNNLTAVHVHVEYQ